MTSIQEKKDQLMTLIEVPLKFYLAYKKMLPEIIEDSKLNRNEKKYFEAAYLLGLTTGANFYIDQEYRYITRENIKDFTNGLGNGKIWNNDKEGDQIIEKIMSTSHHIGIQNIINRGSEQSIATIAKQIAEEGSADKEIENVVSNLYFEDETLLSEFKNYSEEYL